VAPNFVIAGHVRYTLSFNFVNVYATVIVQTRARVEARLPTTRRERAYLDGRRSSWRRARVHIAVALSFSHTHNTSPAQTDELTTSLRSSDSPHRPVARFTPTSATENISTSQTVRQRPQWERDLKIPYDTIYLRALKSLLHGWPA